MRRRLICGGTLVGSLAGLVSTIFVLISGASHEAQWGSPVPGLTLAVGIDPLSAFFLVVIFGLSAATAVYSLGYLEGQAPLLKSLPFFPLLILAMAAVVVARDGFFFLVAWELMSLASFFLVASEHGHREVRHASWIYLIATHLATAFLMVFFILLYQKCGSFLFRDLARVAAPPEMLAGVLFICAVIGFGTKAGIFPFHVWLPHAHPAAPSPVSALMSGVMIKTGVYGILRAATFLGPPPLWWGGLLIILGVLSAVIGAVYALMQKDVKKLLAYSSVENIGIITIGVGLGLMGVARHDPLLTILGLGGALFHVVNHAILKGLLFMGAGTIVHHTGTRDLNRMGGLLKRMPVTGLGLGIAAMALCGLPPLNGFVSEWLIYRGLFSGVDGPRSIVLMLSVVGIVGIAFAGGLILAALTKMIGVALLGGARDAMVVKPAHLPWTLQAPVVFLGALSVLIAICPHAVWALVAPVIRSLDPSVEATAMNGVTLSLGFLGILAVSFGVLASLLIVACHSLIRARGSRQQAMVRQAVTWDCGYAQPSARTQYTASSFAEPLGVVFRALLRPEMEIEKPLGFFPDAGSFSERVIDAAERRFFEPLFGAIEKVSAFVRLIWQGRIQWHLSLIFVALLLLLVWEVWIGI